ncbi:MAG: TrkH family potassium uptake protein [Anaerovoracaceae bacterium]|jgi:trk system potassium uptake protein TrkH
MHLRYRTLIKLSSFMLMITGIAMLPSFLCARIYGQVNAEWGFLLTGGISAIVGFILFNFVHASPKGLTSRDGYMAVIMSWLLCSLIGTIPYLASGEVTSFADALFESVAGYTTTGATVLSHHLSNPLILWKVTCHWLGGMGILIFVISILPALGTGGQRIASAEAPGPELSKMAPRMTDFSKMLYLIYSTLTAVEWLMLWLGSKMNAFEALINAMGSISTAGMFMHPKGIAYYNSVYVEVVISVFTILASVNFIVYMHLMRRNFDSVRKNMEIRIFLAMIAVGTAIVTAALRISGTFPTVASSLRHAFFQVTSFATTSGFAMDDYNKWPSICLALFFILLFVGGCAASTSGGLKVIRVSVMLKLIARGLHLRIHPRSVRAVKLGKTVISAPMANMVTCFILLYGILFFVGSVIMSLQGLDMETTLSSTASMMSTTGISIGDIGSTGNFGVYCPALKIFCCVLMTTGRLELIAVVLLLFPSYWNPDRFQVK